MSVSLIYHPTRQQTSLAVRPIWGIAISCLLFLLPGGCGEREKGDPVPPFKVVHANHSSDAFAKWYAQDEVEADKMFKEKVVTIDSCSGPFENVKTDESGEKYASYWVQDSKEPRGVREAIRCYMYRPNDPVVTRKGAYYGATGVCKGKVNGVVVLRNCSFSGWGGPDW